MDVLRLLATFWRPAVMFSADVDGLGLVPDPFFLKFCDYPTQLMHMEHFALQNLEEICKSSQ